MYPNICHIYGPFYLNCYGLSIAIALLTFSSLIKKNSEFKSLISIENFKNVMLFAIVVGVVCGRILGMAEEWNRIRFYEIFYLWEPGYSFLGTLIGLIVFVPIYLRKIKVPILPFLDIASIYAPLMHAIARIGCFLAGCCHGIPTSAAWGVTYTHEDVAVPTYLKFIKIHPTQLYTAIFLLILFISMICIFRHTFKKTGQLSAIYLIFSSLDRFFNDYYRADRDFSNYPILNLFSFHQWLSLIILLSGIILFYLATYQSKVIKSSATNQI